MTAPLQIGRYELIQPIASGGMATVYLARSRGARGFERQVALKVMHPHLAEDPEFVAMFLDEARMAANIRHPNVVPTLDVVEDEGQLFLVMEYVEGHSLQALDRSMKKRRVPMPLEAALRITLDMLAGLHAAHELTMPDGRSMKLVHRDISPHNVLVGIDGSSRIMDFGVARAEIRVNSTIGASPKGKLPYMSPEQILSSGVDHRADIYAAGIVLWEMLAGTGLFRADNEGALLHLVVAGTKRSPAEVRPELPAAICAVCMRALAVSPDDRYPTAAAFGEALEQAASEAKVMIASPRVVAGLVKEVPPDKPRSPSAGSLPGSVGGSDPMRPSFVSGEVSSSAPVVTPVGAREATPSKAPPAGSSIVAGASDSPPRPSLSPELGTGSVSAETGVIQAAPSKNRRSAVIAGGAALLLAGGLVWFFSSGADQTKPDGSAAAPPPGVDAAPAAVVIPSAVAAPSASPMASSSSSAAPVASAQPSGAREAGATSAAAPKPTAPKATPPPEGAPRAGTKKPPSTTFRPEEP